jgi:hypothetical protein
MISPTTYDTNNIYLTPLTIYGAMVDFLKCVLKLKNLKVKICI